MMDPHGVELRIAKILEHEGDWEVTHSMEDDLLMDFVRAVAAGECVCPEYTASLLVKMWDRPEAGRWYA